MSELLTPQELGEYLKLKYTTILRKARKGEIPAIRIGKQFRFDKGQIDRWLLQKTVGRPMHILVIDDNPVIGALFKNSLKNSLCEVTATLSSIEALELIAKNNFDLIFLDLLMPEIDGGELFRRIRETNEDTPIAIITGYPDSDLMEKAMRQGPFLVMTKPFDSNDILKAVRSFTQVETAKE